jgi:hypothetical protein
MDFEFVLKPFLHTQLVDEESLSEFPSVLAQGAWQDFTGKDPILTVTTSSVWVGHLH